MINAEVAMTIDVELSPELALLFSPDVARQYFVFLKNQPWGYRNIAAVKFPSAIGGSCFL